MLRKPSHDAGIAGALVSLFLVVWTGSLEAGGPIGVTSTGAPFKWNNGGPVRYRTDQGNLGNRSGATADSLVATSFSTWTDLPDVNLSASRDGDLGADVTTANVFSFIKEPDDPNFVDGITPIIYDTDGSITDAIIGTGASNSVLGFAGPDVVDPGSGIISEGVAVLNGALLDSQSDAQVRTVLVHELGHMLGLAHSQLNQEFFNNGVGADDIQIPIMYPILRNTDNAATPATPTPDDVASMAWLYRQSNFDSGFGHITGKVLDAAGAEFRGANVVARLVSQAPTLRLPFLGTPGPNSWVWPSGIATASGAPFEFHLLPAGDYILFVEPIDPAFRGGSRVGSFDPAPTGVTAEFWNGTSEDSSPFTDDPTQSVTVTVAAGQTRANTDFKLQAADGVTLQLTDTVTATITSVNGALPPAQFRIEVPANAKAMVIELRAAGGENLHLHVRRASEVTSLVLGLGLVPLAITADFSSTLGTGVESVTINGSTNPPLASGTYFVAPVNNTAGPVQFTLTTQTTLDPTTAAASTGNAAGGGGSFLAGCRGASPGTPAHPLGTLLLFLPLALFLVRSRRLRLVPVRLP